VDGLTLPKWEKQITFKKKLKKPGSILPAMLALMSGMVWVISELGDSNWS
jgi:hypothetical protein